MTRNEAERAGPAKIDELRIYGRVLSAAEVAAIGACAAGRDRYFEDPKSMGVNPP